MIRSEDQTGLARQGERMGRVEKNGNRRLHRLCGEATMNASFLLVRNLYERPCPNHWNLSDIFNTGNR